MFKQILNLYREHGALGFLRILISYRSRKAPIVKHSKLDENEFWFIENDAIAKQVLIDGKCWKPHFYEILTLLAPKTNCIDLGANIGLHSIRMRKIITGTIFAFEPQSLIFSILQMNVLKNNADNVLCYRLAASNATGSYLEMEKVQFGNLLLNTGNASVGIGGDPCLSIKIDDMSFPKIGFIKMDIQGSEYRALCGMQRTLTEDRPILFVEIEEHHLRKNGTSSEEVIKFIFSVDYIVYRIKNSYPCDHVCVPKEIDSEIESRLRECCSDPLDRLEGNNVSLSFENRAFYSEFRCN